MGGQQQCGACAELQQVHGIDPERKDTPVASQPLDQFGGGKRSDRDHIPPLQVHPTPQRRLGRDRRQRQPPATGSTHLPCLIEDAKLCDGLRAQIDAASTGKQRSASVTNRIVPLL